MNRVVSFGTDMIDTISSRSPETNASRRYDNVYYGGG